MLKNILQILKIQKEIPTQIHTVEPVQDGEKKSCNK